MSLFAVLRCVQIAMSVVLIALTLVLIAVFAFHALIFFRKTCTHSLIAALHRS